MKKGDLVKVVRPTTLPEIQVGDLAILTEVDWDQRDYPNGIPTGNGERNMGRGYFFFPNRPELHRRIKSDRPGPPGVMLLFNSFEVLSEG